MPRTTRRGRTKTGGCHDRLPTALAEAGSADAIRLIYVLWIEEGGAVAAAFEVEHSTSIYSGIVRILDLALGIDGAAARNFVLVAPDDREGEVRSQFARLAFPSSICAAFLIAHYGTTAIAIARFGNGIRGIAIARPITLDISAAPRPTARARGPRS